MTTKLAFNQISGSIVNVREFGAISGADSTSSIQDAINDTYTNGGGDVVISANYLYSSTLFLRDNVRLIVDKGASLRPVSGLGDVPGTGLFVTIAALSRYRFGAGSVNFKGAVSAYQGPHTNISIVNNGIIEGTLQSGGSHDIADAACIHIEDCTNFEYSGLGLIENCDASALRIDGTGATAPTWTTLALADTNTSIGNTTNAVVNNLRTSNTNFGVELQNYPKNITLANFSIDDTASHGLRLTSARDVNSYGHYLTNVNGSSIQLLEGQSYNLYGSPHLECSDQIAIQIGEVDDVHIHGNHIVTGQFGHIGTGPNAERVYIQNNVWGDENDEFATGAGLINSANIDQLYVRDLLPNNTAKTMFENKRVGAADLFRYYLSANQTGITPGVFTKIQFNTKDFEDGSSYDAVTNYEATPAKGRYVVQGRLRIADDGGTIADQDPINVALYKAGVQHAISRVKANGTGVQEVDFSFLVDVNGSNTLDIRLDPGGTGTKQVSSGSTLSRIEMYPVNA